MSYQQQPATKAPSPHTLVRRLRKTYPEIYKEITADFQPLKYPFTLIEPLYKATDDRVLFFGAMLLLYSKFPNPASMPCHRLHGGVGLRISVITGLPTSYVSISLSQAVVYSKIPGFREQVKQFIFDTVGITV